MDRSPRAGPWQEAFGVSAVVELIMATSVEGLGDFSIVPAQGIQPQRGQMEGSTDLLRAGQKAPGVSAPGRTVAPSWEPCGLFRPA